MTRRPLTTAYANKLVAEARKALRDPAVAPGDHLLFSHLLGVTSPMENPVSNFLYALEAYQKFKAGDYDKHIDLYRKAYDMKKASTLQQEHVDDLTGKPTKSDAHAMSEYIQHHDIVPRRDNGKLYGFHSDGVLQALARTLAEEANAPKTKNYASNLFSDKTTQATIDTWASRTMRRLGYQGGDAPWRLMPQSENVPTDLEFGFSQRAFDKAAKKLGMDADSLQAIM
jgi:hypothetical protein